MQQGKIQNLSIFLDTSAVNKKSWCNVVLNPHLIKHKRLYLLWLINIRMISPFHMAYLLYALVCLHTVGSLKWTSVTHACHIYVFAEICTFTWTLYEWIHDLWIALLLQPLCCLMWLQNYFTGTEDVALCVVSSVVFLLISILYSLQNNVSVFSLIPLLSFPDIWHMNHRGCTKRQWTNWSAFNPPPPYFFPRSSHQTNIGAWSVLKVFWMCFSWI